MEIQIVEEPKSDIKTKMVENMDGRLMQNHMKTECWEDK